MIDREKVLTVLRRRFGGATDETLAAAANAIVGLPDEWEDITYEDGRYLGESAGCTESGKPGWHQHAATEFRLFRRRIA
jgi:hypothetical protein